MNNENTQQDTQGRQQLESYVTKRAEVDLSIEVVLLIIGGVFFLLFGVLLFLINKGMLPYSEDSMYGLFVVLVSMQIITMGKTPFGDLLRSWVVVIIGLGTAILGTLAIFFPGHLSVTIRVLAGLIVLITGTLGLLQLFTSKNKARTWMKVPGILQQLTVACAVVYGIEVVLGIITLLPGIVPNPLTAVILVIFGAGIFFLAWCIHEANRQYRPGNEKKVPPPPRSERGICLFRDATLTVGNTFNTYQGILLTLLGFLVLFMILGIFPSYNTDGQFGLLLVLTSLQLLALGQFVGSQMTRSWVVITLGILFAGAGIFSCIVPGMLTGMIQTFLGLLNIIGGASSLIRRYAPMPHKSRVSASAPSPVPPTVRKLMLTQTVLNLVTVVFGVSMLVPSLVSGLVVAGILVVNGLLLFALASLLQELTRMQPSG